MNNQERKIVLKCYGHYREFPEVTKHDDEIHCNYGTGNDLTGKGTAALPYKTPIRAMQDVAARIAHKINIVLGGPGAYAAGSFPRKIDNIIEGDGSLTFYGVGAPTRKAVTGGPHTVTAIASNANSQKITVNGAAWTVDEFCGYWVRVITGGHVGRAWPVFGNGANTIMLPADSDGVHNGDTVEIIAPAIKVAVEDLDIYYDAHSMATAAGLAYSRLAFANIWLDASASGSPNGQLRLHGSVGNSEGPIFDFCRFDALDSGVHILNSWPNYVLALDPSYVAACGASIVTMGGYYGGAGMSITSVGLRAATLVSLYGVGGIQNVAVTGKVFIVRLSSAYFSGGAAGIHGNGAMGGEVWAWLSGIAAGTPAVFLEGGNWGNVSVNVERDCNYAVDTDYGAIVRLHGECTCSATLCTLSALRIGPLCKVTSDHALAGFLGATATQNAYTFQQDATKESATWPAAHGYATDLIGGEFLRVA